MKVFLTGFLFPFFMMAQEQVVAPAKNSEMQQNATNSVESTVILFDSISTDVNVRKSKSPASSKKSVTLKSVEAVEKNASENFEENLDEKSDLRKDEFVPTLEDDSQIFSSEIAQQNFTQLNFAASTNNFRRSPLTFEDKQIKSTAFALYHSDAKNGFNNLALYQSNHHDVAFAQNLLFSLAVDSTNLEANKQACLYYIQTDSLEKFNQIAESRLFGSYYTINHISYYTDVLNSIPNESTLLLHGFSDLIAIQNAMSRTDKKVELLSAELMQSSYYRNNLKNLGYSLPAGSFIDTAYIAQFCAINPSKEIYLSMTFPKEYLSGISAFLHPSGLTLKYGALKSNQGYYNAQLFENSFNKSNLSLKTYDSSDGLSINYLPSMLETKKYYLELGLQDKVQIVDRKINEILLRSSKNVPPSLLEK